MRGVLGREGRTEPVDVGDGGPVPADRRGESLSGHARALVAVARMPEVGVTVDMHQFDAATAHGRETCAEQDRAVAADHERSLAPVERCADACRQTPRMVDRGTLVAHVSGRSHGIVVDVAAGQDDAGVGRPELGEPGEQAGLAQSLRCLRCAGDAARLGRTQAEIGRSRQHRDHACILNRGSDIRAGIRQGSAPR